VAYITHGMGPSEVLRIDQQRVVFVSANIVDRPLNKVIEDVEVLINNIETEKLDMALAKSEAEKDISMTITGESQQMGESFDSLRFALILSILMVYMIMASQFESLWQPFIIMFTVPLSLIGVLISLFLTHTPLSVVVILGVIILGGIVVNNGIILIDCINGLRSKGVGLIEAVAESGKNRLRPIFMTTMTTVLGLFPLALGVSEGSEMQSPMAITVMGGLMLSTVLTLFVIPCIYTIVAGFMERRTVTIPQPKITKPKFVLPTQIKPELPEEKVKEKAMPKIKPFILTQEPAKTVKPEEPVISQKPPIEYKPPESPKPPAPEAPDSQPPKVIELPQTPKAEANGLSRLNKRQQRLLEHLKEAKGISRKEYAQLFKVSVPTAARDLKELLDKGYLVVHGPLGPGRWYELK